MSTDIAPMDTEFAAEPEGGLGTLATSRGNLPLEAVDVRAVIVGLSASVEVTQGFRNPFGVPLEATYIFPLPDRAAVTAMRMEAAGHVVEGVLKERSQARADYDQAIAQGQRAAIAEEERPDVFTMRVGNIAPGERVTVRLTLAQPLPYSGGEATFRFPLVVAPRYIPGRPLDGPPAGSGAAADTDAVPDASRISPPVLLPGFPNPVRLTLSAEIDPAGLPLAGIRCSLHAIMEEAVAGGRTMVRLQPGERLNRDFILRLAVAGHEQVATSLVLTQDPVTPDPVTQEPGDRSPQGTFSLTLVPPAGTGLARPRDVVLVLDRSGSMHGWKMVAARRAAARIVDTLTDVDRFAVLCFDTVVEGVLDLSPGLAAATDRNRFRAIEKLARTEARGGTEMLAPLQEAIRLLTDAAGPELAAAQPAARDRVLVMVTDGQVGHEDQILQRIVPSLGRIRVHVVGIDRAVNTGFLSRLAGAGRGRCELVESEDRLDAAAAHIHRRIGNPLVTALTLAADGLRIEAGAVAPSLLPDLFPGVPVTVAGRWRGQPAGTITVRGVWADGTPFEAAAAAVTGGTPATTADWARAHLRDLEDRYVSLDGRDAGALDRLERQITDVSLGYGVLCRFTAFLAVDSRVVTDGGATHRVTQPVELPAGWDPAGLGAPLAAAEGAMPAMPPAAMPAMPTAAMPVAMPMQAPTPPAADAARMPGGGPRPGNARPKKRSAGFEASRRATAAPGSASRPGGPAREAQPRLLAVRDQITDELAALRLARRDPDAERLRFLADLATRLDALIAWLAGEPGWTGELPGLIHWVPRLRACDAPGAPRGADLDALWDETIRLLTGLTQDPAQGPTPPQSGGTGPDRGRAFWKRPR